MRRSDLPAVNRILSKAFTAARISDGFKKTHVPLCHLSFLEMYLAAFPPGCFVIENENGLVGYTFARLWGEVGWIGPASIIPAHQGKHLGQRLMVSAMEVLKSAGARVIGLETMPRSYRNIGFYTKLGFVPQNLTIDLTMAVPPILQDPLPANDEVIFYSDLDPAQRALVASTADELARRIDPHLSIRPEIELTCRFEYGDALCIRGGRGLLACLIIHTKTYSEEEVPRYMKITQMIVDPALSVDEIVPHLFAYATREHLDTISIRTPTRYYRAYTELVAAGFQVFHSELRMTLEGYHEVADPRSFNLSKWE
jgi:GNAT superfamily N-acetyltransferase